MPGAAGDVVSVVPMASMVRPSVGSMEGGDVGTAASPTINGEFHRTAPRLTSDRARRDLDARVAVVVLDELRGQVVGGSLSKDLRVLGRLFREVGGTVSAA